MASKREELIQKFAERGHDRVRVKWIPSNPHGRQHKATGWVFKLSGDTECLSLVKTLRIL